MATGKFAKDSSAPLGTEDGGAEDCEAEETGKSDGDAIANEGNNGATSSASKDQQDWQDQQQQEEQQEVEA